jgi:hypothetical protein
MNRQPAGHAEYVGLPIPATFGERLLFDYESVPRNFDIEYSGILSISNDVNAKFPIK